LYSYALLFKFEMCKSLVRPLCFFGWDVKTASLMFCK